jgi:hypothetical protein
MTARSGMTDLITNLRGMTEAGTADYTSGVSTFWSDDQVQMILDRHKSIVDFAQMGIVYQRTGQTWMTKIYDAGQPNWEQPLVVKDAYGTVIGTALYTVDYDQGRVIFANDTGMALYNVSGTIYNLYGAAAEIWRMKAAHYAGAYDLSTDNHSLKRSQLMAQANAMAVQYGVMANPGGSIFTERGDMYG